MSGPIEVTVKDYTDKSIVVRSEPKDALKSYTEYLKNLGGRFNPHLKAEDGVTKEPGWIFSSKKRDEVQELVNKIMQSELVPMATQPRTYSKSQTNVPNFPQATPTNPLVKPGYQQISFTALKPELYETLNLNIGPDKYPVKIVEIETSNGIVHAAVIELSDGQQSRIRLRLPEMDWKIEGFETPHNITK